MFGVRVDRDVGLRSLRWRSAGRAVDAVGPVERYRGHVVQTNS